MRFAGFPDWHINRVRLAAHMVVAFFFVESSSCWCELNGTRLELKQGDLLTTQGADEFEFGHDPRHPVVSLIQEIAGECGFTCPFYFSRVFRKRFGRTPSTFRKPARKVR